MSSDHDADVVGFDVPTIERWLATVTTVPLADRLAGLPGGHSNLTYLLVDDAGRELVIRRPPLGELLPKAHDMWREYRVIEALWPTAVPVPEPVAYCDDRSIAETHFYVMGKAEGRALYSGAEVAQWLEVPARRRAGESFIDVLARAALDHTGGRRPRRSRPPRRLRRPPTPHVVRLVDVVGRRTPSTTIRGCTSCTIGSPRRSPRPVPPESCTATSGRTTVCSPAPAS